MGVARPLGYQAHCVLFVYFLREILCLMLNDFLLAVGFPWPKQATKYLKEKADITYNLGGLVARLDGFSQIPFQKASI